MYVWGRLSKQNGESIWNIVIPCVVGGAGLLMGAESLATPVLATASFCVAGLGLYAAIPAFWGYHQQYSVARLLRVDSPLPMRLDPSYIRTMSYCS